MKANNTYYTQIYREYIDGLYNYGISLGFADNMCMDAIHDVFCYLFASRKEFDNEYDIKYYLLRSLKNRLFDINKKQIKFNDDGLPEYQFSVEVSVMDTFIDNEERTLIENKVKSLIDSLTDNQKEVLYLRYMQEMEYEDIAELLNISVASVRTLAYRGIDRLRKQNNLGVIPILLLCFIK